ncbi:MAG: retroviral-like aspartic protease family protein [Dehalococcoidia bacterium]
MGTFRVEIEIGDPAGERWETVEALVDTGASHTRVPRSVLERLAVEPTERWPFRLADDREVEYDVAQTQVRIDGRARFSIVVFGDDGSDALLGAATLGMFALDTDPLARRLIPASGLRV